MTSTIVCDVCPRACQLPEGRKGFCGARTNIGGENRDALYQQFYDCVSYFNELPFGQPMYAPYLVGCNLKCWFCAVPWVSRPALRAPLQTIPELELVNRAIDLNVASVRLLGGEPAIHHEYMAEVGRLCRENRIPTVLATSGYVKPWVAEKLGRTGVRPIIGIKGSASPKIYSRMNADPQPVLEATKVFWEINHETMLTDLVGPGLDVTREDQGRLAKWICRNLSSDLIFVVQALMEATEVPCNSPPPYVGGARNAHDASYRAASTLARNGLTNVWMLNAYAIGRGRLEPGETGFVHVTERGMDRKAQVPFSW